MYIPEVIHEFIDKTVIYAPDKSSGHTIHQIDIHYRFNVPTSTVTADSMVYDKKRKAAQFVAAQPFGTYDKISLSTAH